MTCPICQFENPQQIRHITTLGEKRVAEICEKCERGWIPTDEFAADLGELYEGLDDYSKVSPPSYNLKQKLIASSLATRFKFPDKLLDIGCGAGDFLTQAGSFTAWKFWGKELRWPKKRGRND